MSSIIKIAVDAMGGDNSPQKIVDGIIHHHKSNKNVFFSSYYENVVKNGERSDLIERHAELSCILYDLDMKIAFELSLSSVGRSATLKASLPSVSAASSNMMRS